MAFKQVPIAGFYVSVEEAQPEDRLCITLQSGEVFSFEYRPDPHNPRMILDRKRTSESALRTAEDRGMDTFGTRTIWLFFKVYDPKWETHQPQVGKPLTLIIANKGSSGIEYRVPGDSIITSIESTTVLSMAEF